MQITRIRSSYLVKIILWIHRCVLEWIIIDTIAISSGGTDASMKSSVQSWSLCPPWTDSCSIIYLKGGKSFCYSDIGYNKNKKQDKTNYVGHSYLCILKFEWILYKRMYQTIYNLNGIPEPPNIPEKVCNSSLPSDNTGRI